MFDVLLWTKSMRRVIEQGWPKDASEMYVFDSVDDVLEEVPQIISFATDDLEEGGRFEIETVQPIYIEPWGVTSTVFVLRKFT